MLTPSNLTTNEVAELSIISQTTSDDECVRTLLQEIQTEYHQLLQTPSAEGRWHSLSEMDLWLLLCRCILSAETQYETALSTVAILWQNGHLNPYMLTDLKDAKKDLAAKLSTLLDSKRGSQYSQYFVKNAQRLREQSLSWLLKHSPSEEEARKNLCERFKGVGLKEASVFLRDSCYARDLVVVDTHIVRFLKILGLVKPDVNAAQITPKAYRVLEYLFRGYCENHGVNHQRMEQALWKVLRV